MNSKALLSKSHMSYDIERNKTDEPSLIEMTQKAIELLSTNPKGYFLLIEGGKIDHGKSYFWINIKLKY